MKDKHFILTIILISIVGILGLSLLMGYAFKLKGESSIITIITTESW